MKKDSQFPATPSVEDYKRLVERLRVRLNVLNASVFLLEEKLSYIDPHTIDYVERVNEQLELLRSLILEEPGSAGPN